MFEDALLDSSPRQTFVLHRIHYLLSALTGTLFWGLGMYLLPLLVALAAPRARFVAAAMAGVVAGAYALMLCYVWADTRQQHLRTWLWFGVALLLNLPGFLLYLVYSAQKSGDWKRAAIPLAYVAESMLVGVLVLVPLIYTQALPRQLLITGVHIPPPPGPPPAQPAGPRPKPTPHHAVDLSAAPTFIPIGVKPVVDRPAPSRMDVGTGPGVIGAPPGGSYGGPGNSVIDSLIAGGEQPPPPAVLAPPKTRVVYLSSGVVAAKALYQPKPAYPQLAVGARIQGTVILQAIIDKDGTVQDLKVMSGHPLLVRAAIEAVRTWRYQPTLLNTDPVQVLTEIDVNFKLGE